MNWEKHKEDLDEGKTVEFRPKGNSMIPKIESGQLVTVVPIEDHEEIEKGDIVFCKVKGSYYVHLVSATEQKGDKLRFQISNNKGRVNGWISQSNVFGKVSKVED